MKKFLKLLKSIVENFWVRLVFLLGLVVGIFAISGAFESGEKAGEKILDFITSGDVLSVFLAAILSLLVVQLVTKAMQVLEESFKIEDDHHKIICMYDGHHDDKDVDPTVNLYDKDGVYMSLKRVPKQNRTGKNPERDKRSDAYKKRKKDIAAYTEKGKLYLPSVSVFTNVTGDTSVVFSDKADMFQLPVFVRENLLKFMEAHKASNVSNSITIRLNDIDFSGDVLTLKTERSQYFDMLATNRCMDYHPDGNISVREKYEFEPAVTPLAKSRLSNQIGINGLIITSDGYLLVEKRGRKKTTWKDKFAQPISLAMKRKDVGIENGETLGKTPEIANDVFKKIILTTIRNNFGLKEEDINGFDMKTNFMGIARDLLEGGKPNMYFYVMTRMTAKQLKSTLEENSKTASQEIDGDKKVYPKVTTDKLDSDYYLIHHSDIVIDYNYELKVKAKNVMRVQRRFAPCVSKFRQATDGNVYRLKRAFGGSIKKECGEALLACLYYSDACKERIKAEQEKIINA